MTRFPAIGLAVSLLLSAATFATVVRPASAETLASLPDLETWPATLEQEQQLATYQQDAMEAGALGFYRSRGSATLVTVVSDQALGRVSEVATNFRAPVSMSIETSPLNAELIDAIGARLREFGKKAATPSDSLAFFFNAELGLVTVSTSLRPQDLAAALGDLWQYVDYRRGFAQSRGRFNDIPAFYGGAAFDVLNWGEPDWDCTTGFTVINGSGKKGLVTAAHCGNDHSNKAVQTPAGVALGSIENRHCPDPEGADVELITGKTYDNYIYIGFTAAGSSIEVSSAGAPVVGGTYGFSGAASYEHTNQKMLSINTSYLSNACDQLEWVTAMSWWRVRAYDETCDLRPGDSGGPFYYKFTGSPGTVAIRGMSTAGDDQICYGITYPRITTKLAGYSIYVH